MGIVAKLLVSLAFVLVGVGVLYASAFSFGANGLAILVVRWLIGGLTLAGIALLWRNQMTWSMASMGGVVLMLGLVSWLSR